MPAVNATKRSRLSADAQKDKPLQHTYSHSAPSSSMSSRTDDPTVWQLARDWLEDCIGNHEECREQNATAWYPSRLIHIGPGRFGESDDADVNLHITGLETPCGPYMTLSHCWGDSTGTIKLLSDTVESMKRRIPLASLPATFRDAVRFARFCSIKYLWIDSLCIMQDSHDDWELEARTMSEVYQHSHCNINATASASSNGGCFFGRDPTSIVFPRVKLDKSLAEEKSSSDTKKARLAAKHNFICVPISFWKRNIEEAPLNARAWVLQERLLSPRHVHCCRDQLFWQCQERRACEACPTSVLDDMVVEGLHQERSPLTGLPEGDFTRLPADVRFWKATKQMVENDFSDSDFSDANRSDTNLAATGIRASQSSELSIQGLTTQKHNFSHLSGFLDGVMVPDMPEPLEIATKAVYTSWRDMVIKYSTCGLTYQTDKLIAIYGIANYVEDSGFDQSLAGLWQRSLAFDLLWTVKAPRDRVIRNSPSMSRQSTSIQFPSWSWASVGMPVKLFHRLDYLENLSLINTHNVQLRDKSPGIRSPKQLKDFILRIRAHIFVATAKTSPEQSRGTDLRGEVQAGQVQKSDGIEKSGRRRNWFSRTILRRSSPKPSQPPKQRLSYKPEQEQSSEPIARLIYHIKIGGRGYGMELESDRLDSGQFPETLALLPLVVTTSILRHNRVRQWSLEALLLQQVGGTQSFRRIGTWRSLNFCNTNIYNASDCSIDISHAILREMEYNPNRVQDLLLI